MCGCPSCTLLMDSTARPCARSHVAVPRVARSENPCAASRRATGTAAAFSVSGTEMNALPARGRKVPAAICALANAAPKLPSIPITSPVDFISGPSTVSTPGNLMKGKTASLTLTWRGTTSAVNPWSASERPIMQRAAIFEGVGVDRGGIFEQVFDEDRMRGRDAHRRFHVARQAGGIVDDLHGAAPEDVGGTDEDGIADPLRDTRRFLRGTRHTVRGPA